MQLGLIPKCTVILISCNIFAAFHLQTMKRMRLHMRFYKCTVSLIDCNIFLMHFIPISQQGCNFKWFTKIFVCISSFQSLKRIRRADRRGSEVSPEIVLSWLQDTYACLLANCCEDEIDGEVSSTITEDVLCFHSATGVTFFTMCKSLWYILLRR